jgi:hypothetical protein
VNYPYSFSVLPNLISGFGSGDITLSATTVMNHGRNEESSMCVFMQIRKQLSDQQGAIAIIAAVSAIVLLGIAAFVIILGIAAITTAPNAADAGALAGARALGKFYCPETIPLILVNLKLTR